MNTAALIISALLLDAHPVVAQSLTRGDLGLPPVESTGTIRGVIIDGAGRPFPQAIVSVSWPATASPAFSLPDGTFFLPFVSPGNVEVDVHCPSRTLSGLLLVKIQIRASPRDTTTLPSPIRAGYCSEPDSGARTGTYLGYYSAGFEESGFYPCLGAPDGADSLWSAFPERRRAWVAFRAPASYRAAPRDRTPDGYRYGSPYWYVEFHGTLIGPGWFGHLGVSPYLLQVDSVLPRRPEADACSPPAAW